MLYYIIFCAIVNGVAIYTFRHRLAAVVLPILIAVDVIAYYALPFWN